jgi:succinyl-diaminopimelate desuccinylase
VVEFGPPNATIHQVNERIALTDLRPLQAIYQNAIRRLLVDLPAQQDGRRSAASA